MKMTILIIACAISMNILSQDYSKLKDINLSDSINCIKAESKVVECCNYLLNQPCVESLQCLEAQSFIIDWQIKTPSYQFSLHNKLYKQIVKDNNLAGRYYACLAKVAIEKKNTNDIPNVQYEAIKLFLEYCEKADSKVKVNKGLQKYIDAKNSNKLREYIKEV